MPPELGIERRSQRSQVQAVQRAAPAAPAQRHDQPVNLADGLGERPHLLGAAAVGLVCAQPRIGDCDGGQAFLAPPGHVDGRAEPEERAVARPIPDVPPTMRAVAPAWMVCSVM